LEKGYHTVFNWMKKGVDLEQVKVKTWFEENHRVEGPNVISARLVFFVLLSESSQSSFWWSIKLLTCRACSTCNNYFCKYLKYCPAVKRIFFLFFFIRVRISMYTPIISTIPYMLTEFARCSVDRGISRSAHKLARTPT
jgi:hypothetical protein